MVWLCISPPAKDLPKLLGSVNWNKYSKFRMDRKKAELGLCSTRRISIGLSGAPVWKRDCFAVLYFLR
jgi:hypothetical protein